jgi:hypothetical protein
MSLAERVPDVGVGLTVAAQRFSEGPSMLDVRQTASSPHSRPPADAQPLIVDEQDVKRAVGATAMGNMMEWFDFGIYSYLAVVLGKVFFPGSGTMGLIYCARSSASSRVPCAWSAARSG